MLGVLGTTYWRRRGRGRGVVRKRDRASVPFCGEIIILIVTPFYNHCHISITFKGHWFKGPKPRIPAWSIFSLSESRHSPSASFCCQSF